MLLHRDSDDVPESFDNRMAIATSRRSQLLTARVNGVLISLNGVLIGFDRVSIGLNPVLIGF